MSAWWSAHAMQAAVLLTVFLAVGLAVEGLVLIWHHTSSPGVVRLRRRMKAWVPQMAVDPGTDGRRRGLNGSAPPSRLQSMVWRSIDQAGWNWSAGQLAGLSLSLGTLFALLLGAAAHGSGADLAAPAAVGGMLGAGAPWLALAYCRQRRLAQINRQLADALALIARAMRSGHAFSSAVQMVAEESAAPLSREFAQVHEQVALGRDISLALEALVQRIPLDDLRLFTMAVRLQRQTGGNLAEVLDNISGLVRERLKLSAKVHALSAEGRLSAKVLSLMPPVTGGALYLIKPDMIRLLWTDPVGVALLQIGTVLFVAGSLWMWRMTRITV